MTDPDEIILESERLLITPPREKDAADLARISSHPLIKKNIFTCPKNENEAKIMISTMMMWWDIDFSHVFVFRLKDTGRLVGTAGVNEINRRHMKAILAYWCDVDHWGKGYTSEAVTRLIDYCFDDLELNRVEASCFTSNPASARVMENAGMSLEYISRHHYRKDGDFHDAWHYAILRSDREPCKS